LTAELLAAVGGVLTGLLAVSTLWYVNWRIGIANSWFRHHRFAAMLGAQMAGMLIMVLGILICWLTMKTLLIWYAVTAVLIMLVTYTITVLRMNRSKQD